MTLTISELLAHSYVLTVDKRKLFAFNQTFRRMGLEPLPKPYSGRMVDRGSAEYRVNKHFVAAHMSHFEICELAMRSGWPFVCIFEEDAIPCKDILHELAEHLRDIPDDAYILKLGYVRFDSEVMKIPCAGKFECLSDRKFQERFFGGSHAYIIFNGFYKFNAEMLSCCRSKLERIKDIIPIHSPGNLQDARTDVEWWYYEWLMTPKVYRNGLQARMYAVETRCNLFVQPDYVSWDADVSRWFDAAFGPSFARRVMRKLAGALPWAYRLYQVILWRCKTKR